MQFKLTVALLAALSVAEASHGHRAQYRHLVRRQGYEYGQAPNSTTSAAESVAPTTTDAAVEESSTASLTFGTTTAESVEFTYPTGTGATASSVLPITFAPTGTAPAIPSGTGSSSNETSVAGDELVTSTISSTQIFTVTLCPSTVVDCPAKSTSLVTTVIAVGTTVCPQSELDGATPTAEPTGAVVTASNPVSEVTHEVVQTATLTVGPSSSARVITQTFTRTSVETIYQTVTLTRSKASTTATPESSDKPVVGGGEDVEGTTTLTSTSTSTQYITVHSTRTPVAGETGSAVELPTGTAVGGESCAAPSTVTVTAQETVYVTVGNVESATTFTPSAVPEFSTIGEEAPSSTAAEVVPTTIETTITSDLPKQTFAPYPIKNGTHASPTASSGFLTFTKPADYDTAVPTATPAATESSVEPVVVPSTVYVVPMPADSTDGPEASEAPVETSVAPEPTATEAPVESSAAPAETSPTAPAYGSYGRFRRA